MAAVANAVPRNAASSLLSDAEIADAIDAPHSWQVEDYEPVLRFADDPGTQETEAPWERPAGAVSPL